MNIDDIQGVILRGFRSYGTIRHFLFHIADVAGARAFCGRLAPGSGAPVTVTPGTRWTEKPPYCLNVGVSHTGLAQLLGDPNYQVVKNATFDLFQPFDAGADNPAVATAVGDLAGTPSAPANWWKNGKWVLGGVEPSTQLLDLLVTLYAPDAAAREKYAADLLSMCGTAVVPAFVLDCDPLDPPDSIHFGYVDGISQPRIAGYDRENDGQFDDPPVPAFNFVVDPADPNAPYNAHPLVVNGCFGAFRVLHQDTAAFDKFLAQAGADSELVAAKMCGRWRDGTPLEVSPDKPDPSITGPALVNFNYLSASKHQVNPPAAPGYDDSGARCPYASHTRRTNPRDDVKVKPSDPPFFEHRVMRRAFAYGPPYAADPAADRGLAGLFMGVDLQDQFIFLMQTWIQTGFFRDPFDASPNHSGIDPLFGPQPSQDSTDFDYLGPDGTYKTISGLTRFVRTDGSLFVFLPSITALGWLAKGQIPSS